MWKNINKDMIAEFHKKHLTWGNHRDFRLICVGDDYQFVGSYQWRTTGYVSSPYIYNIDRGRTRFCLSPNYKL